MSKRIKVEVSNYDIKHGEAGQCSRCPVARAIARAVKTPTRFVYVCADGVTVNKRKGTGEKTWINTAFTDFPKKVTNFILRFDDGKPVSPFTFYLTID